MIKNAAIVCADTTPERYNVEDQPRGSVGFTVRSHVLGEILRNAKRWHRGYESPQSKSLRYGAIFDCLLLTPFQWHHRYAVVPADAPKKPTKAQRNAKKPTPATMEAIAWWDRFLEDHPGEIVTADENAHVHAAIGRLREDPMISELIESSAKQVMIVGEWHDSSGVTVPLKAMIDVVPSKDHPVFSNSLWDTKTTQNASPHSFSRDAMRFNYALQGAFYLDLFNAATGEMRGDFGHIVQESFHPYEYRTPPPLLSQRFLGQGRLLYRRALSIYIKALQSGVWPSYDHGSKEWPKTDCADYYLAMDTVYDPFEEPQEEPAWMSDDSDREDAPRDDAEVIP